MPLHLILYLVIAVLMVVVIVTFVALVVTFKCRKMKENQASSWIRSVSIEHLRFTPRGMEEQRNRASIPIYANQFTCDFAQPQNIRGATIPTYINPSDIVQNPIELQETNKSKYVFRSFTQEVVEPKFVYWETCI